jgi:transcriptional regulator with XRE-family HTH domain
VTEHEKARQWREARGLSLAQLAELTGYGEGALRWFEKGMTPPLRRAKSGHAKDRTIAPWVWQRFKMACSGADRKLRSGREFDW